MYHPAPPKTYLQIHMYHPFTSKASLFPAAKKIMVRYICIFFSARTKYVRCCVCAELRRSELFLPCFQNFFFVSSVYSMPSQLLASSRKLSSFTVREACCLQKLPGLSLVLTSSPLFNILRHKACCSQSSPLSASDTNHTFFQGLSFGNPLWQNPKSSP